MNGLFPELAKNRSAALIAARLIAVRNIILICPKENAIKKW